MILTGATMSCVNVDLAESSQAWFVARISAFRRRRFREYVACVLDGSSVMADERWKLVHSEFKFRGDAGLIAKLRDHLLKSKGYSW